MSCTAKIVFIISLFLCFFFVFLFFFLVSWAWRHTKCDKMRLSVAFFFLFGRVSNNLIYIDIEFCVPSLSSVFGIRRLFRFRYPSKWCIYSMVLYVPLTTTNGRRILSPMFSSVSFTILHQSDPHLLESIWNRYVIV